MARAQEALWDTNAESDLGSRGGCWFPHGPKLIRARAMELRGVPVPVPAKSWPLVLSRASCCAERKC